MAVKNPITIYPLLKKMEIKPQKINLLNLNKIMAPN